MGGTQKPRSGKMEGLFFYLDVVECKCKLHTSHAWLNLPGSYILNNASLLGREAKQNGSRLVRWCSYSDLEEHSRGRGDWWRFASTDERAYWETAISAFAGFSSWDPPPLPWTHLGSKRPHYYDRYAKFRRARWLCQTCLQLFFPPVFSPLLHLPLESRQPYWLGLTSSWSKEGVGERRDGAADRVTGPQLMGRMGKTREGAECKARSAI